MIAGHRVEFGGCVAQPAALRQGGPLPALTANVKGLGVDRWSPLQGAIGSMPACPRPN